MNKVGILIVTDTQVDFESGALGTKEAVASVPHIVWKIHDRGKDGYIIIDTKDTHDENYLETSEGRHLPVVHTVPGTPGWNIVPEIQEALTKYGAIDILKDKFGSVGLAGAIRVLAGHKLNKIITDGSELEIEIIGWCTDICVIVNALLLKTAFPEAKIIVDSKCCAGVTPEAHEAALTVMKSCQIDVI